MTRRPALVVVLVAVAIGVGACGGTGVTTERSAPTSTAPATSATTGGVVEGPSTTVAPTAPGVDLVEIFLRNGTAGAGRRRVAPTTAVGRAALDQLLAGPDAAERAAGLTTAIATGVRVTDLAIADGTAAVTFSADLAPAAERHRAEAQVVLTLTQFPTVTGVRIGGGPRLTRADVADVLPPILLLSPTPGQTLRSPAAISGINNTFESTFQAQVLGADRQVLATTPVTGTGEMGTWGTFAVTLPFAAPTGGTGFVRVYDTSAETGARVGLVDVPVRFP